MNANHLLMAIIHLISCLGWRNLRGLAPGPVVQHIVCQQFAGDGPMTEWSSTLCANSLLGLPPWPSGPAHCVPTVCWGCHHGPVVQHIVCQQFAGAATMAQWSSTLCANSLLGLPPWPCGPAHCVPTVCWGCHHGPVVQHIVCQQFAGAATMAQWSSTLCANSLLGLPPWPSGPAHCVPTVCWGCHHGPVVQHIVCQQFAGDGAMAQWSSTLCANSLLGLPPCGPAHCVPTVCWGCHHGPVVQHIVCQQFAGAATMALWSSTLCANSLLGLPPWPCGPAHCVPTVCWGWPHGPVVQHIVCQQFAGDGPMAQWSSTLCANSLLGMAQWSSTVCANSLLGMAPWTSGPAQCVPTVCWGCHHGPVVQHIVCQQFAGAATMDQWSSTLCANSLLGLPPWTSGPAQCVPTVCWGWPHGPVVQHIVCQQFAGAGPWPSGPVNCVPTVCWGWPLVQWSSKLCANSLLGMAPWPSCTAHSAPTICWDLVVLLGLTVEQD